MPSSLRYLAMLIALLMASARVHAAPDPCAYPHLSELPVADSAGLVSALAAAQPGTLIRMAPGVYRGNFSTGGSGTAAAPIILCGPRAAVLDGGRRETGYTLHVKGSSHWILSGFTVTRGKDGVMLDRARRNRLVGLRVHDTGQTGIHLRSFSSGNTITRTHIHDTGKVDPGYGEGLYIGTAYSNWPIITGADDRPDRCDGTVVRGNRFGPNIAAEAIDIKEGTSRGRIVGNRFDGAGMSGANYADSWIDVKGNDYLIADNHGVNALLDAFQVHVAWPGWGRNNRFARNHADTGAEGYGFMIAWAALGAGNVVQCDNVVENARLGFANVGCVAVD